MSAEKFEIIIPTQKTYQEFKKSGTYECIEDIQSSSNVESSITVVAENKRGLSEVYQERIDASKADYVVCMHDDVEIHDHFLFKKLLRAHRDFDIVGLAGATSQSYKGPQPPVWHLCRNKPEDARGIVCHYIPRGFNGCSETHINSAYFGPTPSKVVVIDGLFMSFKKATAGSVKLFDPEFTFHHYDMAMCANAIAEGFNIGVWPIHVVHYGLGEFAHDPVWQDHAVKFKAKFGDRKISV